MDLKIVESAKPLVSEKLDAHERDDLFIQLLLGNDATGEVETSRGKFTVKYPKGKDKLAIGRLMSINRGGLPVASFDLESENRNLICSTLNVVVTESPPWLEKIKNKQPNFSFEEVPDDAFISELYRKACEFRDEVQRRLGEKRKTPERVPAKEGVGATVESGLFSGMEGSTAAES